VAVGRDALGPGVVQSAACLWACQIPAVDSDRRRRHFHRRRDPQFSACIFPYAYDSNGSPSIFNGAFVGDAWFIAEPVTVVLGGLIAAILVMIGINRTTGALSAGALVALGVQSTTMWAGYMGIAANQGRIGPGSIIGVVGGVLLIAGGSLALTAVVTERLKQAPAEPTSST